MSDKPNTAKSMLAIIGIIILGLVSITKGLNGDIIKYAMGLILVLGLGEKAIEWWFNRNVGKTTSKIS